MSRIEGYGRIDRSRRVTIRELHPHQRDFDRKLDVEYRRVGERPVNTGELVTVFDRLDCPTLGPLAVEPCAGFVPAGWKAERTRDPAYCIRLNSRIAIEGHPQRLQPVRRRQSHHVRIVEGACTQRVKVVEKIERAPRPSFDPRLGGDG